MQNFDVIVLGVGGVGSAALDHLARRGTRVLGIDRFEPGHDRGSSHGQSRLIRLAYFEHSAYVPLLHRAFDLWHDLEERSGQSLYRQTGLLQVGPAERDVLTGVRTSAQAHNLPIEHLTAREAETRFPGFRVPDECSAIYEQQAGYLLVEECVIAQAKQATLAGAVLRTNETVVSWQPSGEGVVVTTDKERYSAGRLIISAGPWAGQLLGDLGVQLTPLRKPLFWWRTQDDTYAVDRGTPAYLYELPQGTFYGFPQIDALGVKAAEHSGGTEVADPLTVDRQVNEAEATRVADFVAQCLPAATRERTHHVVCMYTMTRDANFIVDRHPRFPQVAFAAGLSGHGFKFACVLGEALADLALEGRTTLPIGFLSVHRPALT